MLLATFEADCSTASELKQAKRRRQSEKQEATAHSVHEQHIKQAATTSSAKDSRSDYMGCKYLTSSQLFLLELQDPAIRQQLAIQLLVGGHRLLCDILQCVFNCVVWCVFGCILL
jgi:hypothetical protein